MALDSYSPLSCLLRRTLRRSPVAWASACGINLRPYQLEIARAVKASVLNHLGLSFVVILPRQSGKNELQAHLFSWLLFRHSTRGGSIVSVSPTFKPQTLNSMDRVRRSLDSCLGSRGSWKTSKGFEYTLGRASIKFFSGDPAAKVVGATADLLLSVDEAQEISIAKFDKDFDPMTASTNATRIFFGTVWTSDTLLERQRRLALAAEQEDGIRRLFFYTAEDVCSLVPSYADHLRRVVAERGRDNPLIRSQYFCETIDAQSGMFNPTRLALLVAEFRQPPSFSSVGAVRREAPCMGEPPLPSNTYPSTRKPPFAFLLDVAGQEECAGGATSAAMPSRRYESSGSSALSNPSRDSTALTVIEIDLSTLADLQRPTYRVVARHSWIGRSHLDVFAQLKNLASLWNPLHFVVDATGVGEGLWSLLDRAFPEKVIPVKFTQSEKSEIGWRFISIIETGRFRDHCHTGPVHLQYTHCRYEILPGPAHTLRWGVPESARAPDGSLVHNDYLLADSLVARLDDLEWVPAFSRPVLFIDPPYHPLEELSLHF